MPRTYTPRPRKKAKPPAALARPREFGERPSWLTQELAKERRQASWDPKDFPEQDPEEIRAVGRPSLPRPERRSQPCTVLLTVKEQAQLRDLAIFHGMSDSTYLRHLLLAALAGKPA